MSEWCLYGDEVREKFERRLEPDSLEGELIRYKEVFGEEFGLKELLTLQDLRVKALIAQAINNVPEFLLDQIGKARNSYEFPSLVRELERIADVMEEVVEEKGNEQQNERGRKKKVIRTYPEMPGVTKRPGVYSSNSLKERSIGK